MTSPKNELLWTIIGLILTIAGTFVQGFIVNVPWLWSEQGINITPLEVTLQMGAVLLTACLGGKRAGALSQIAYIAMGLFYLPVFSEGGGWSYLTEPTFGYIIGFVPAAWYCGRLAFEWPRQLEWLTISCILGLGIIHLMGIVYLVGLHIFHRIVDNDLLPLLPYRIVDNDLLPLLPSMLQYSWEPLGSQLVIICGVAVLAYGLRSILFY